MNYDKREEVLIYTSIEGNKRYDFLLFNIFPLSKKYEGIPFLVAIINYYNKYRIVDTYASHAINSC